MKRSQFPIVILPLFLLLASCATPPSKQGDVVVGEVAGESVTLSELKANYQPTQTTAADSADTIESFLNPYLDYRAKLKAAEEAGYFQHSDLRKEYMDFAVQSAYSYWIENEIKDRLLVEFMERSEQELNASHILISVPENAPPNDTLEAWNSLIEARNAYYKGQPFEKLIDEYSSMRQGRPMGGVLPWFSAGKTVKPFEDTAYSLSPDSVSMPFRTRYGYHIILLNDRRERVQDREISHIFFVTRGRGRSVETAMDSAKAAYADLQAGEPWEAVVKRYTDDKNTAYQAGRIGWVNHGSYRSEFIDTVMAIQDTNVPSRPFFSGYGVHIVKVDSIRTFSSEDQRRAEALRDLEKLPRYKQKRELVLNRLKSELGFAVNSEIETAVGNLFRNQPDSIQLYQVTLPDSLSNAIHMSLGDSTYTASQYRDFLAKEYGKSSANSYRPVWLERYTESQAQQHLVPFTKQTFTDYAVKVEEFERGLAVFKVTEDSVWNYAQQDTAALKAYYASHRDDYRYETRYLHTMLRARADSTLAMARQYIDEGISMDSLRTMKLPMSVKTDSVSLVDVEPYDKLVDMEPGTFSEVFDYKKRKTQLYLHTIMDPRRMSFDEAFYRLASDYQEIREAEWMESIRSRYSVKAYPERLETATED